MSIFKPENSKQGNILDLANYRQKEIQRGGTEDISFNYSLNELAAVIHPGGLKVRVIKIIKENNNTKSFILEGIDKPLPPFKAGQYINVEINKNKKTYRRAYSISSSPKNYQNYRITVKKIDDGMVSSYLFNQIKEQEYLFISEPSGQFTYSKIRDENEILAIAGGSGITPIMSLIYEVIEKDDIKSLTLLYGCKSTSDIIFKTELDDIANKYEKIKVIYVLSEEIREPYKHGYIDKQMILDCEPLTKTIFVCGPVAMYKKLNNIFKELDIPNKYIRYEIGNEKEKMQSQEYKMTLITRDMKYTIPCNARETILESMERHKMKTKSKCTSGVCGFCRSKLIRGKVKTVTTYVRKADIDNNYLHLCVTYPLSDVVIKVNY